MSSLKIYQDDNCTLFKKCDLFFDKNSYIVATENNILGFFNLMTYDKKTVLIDYELLKEYRNKGIGNDFYKMIEQYVIENFEYEKIILVIAYNNCRSTSIAIHHNYSLDNDFDEQNEAHNHKIYIKRINRKQQ